MSFLSLSTTTKPVTCTTVFALAAILRFLTPSKQNVGKPPQNGVYRGWLDGFDREKINQLPSQTEQKGTTTTYADGLRYNISEGWYEFKCLCDINITSGVGKLPQLLAIARKANQPCEYEEVIKAYFMKHDGGKMGALCHDPKSMESFQLLVCSTATLYARMIAGDGMFNLLREMMDKQGVYEQDGFSTNMQLLADSPMNESSDNAPLHFQSTPIPEGSNLLKDKNVGCDINVIKRVVFSEVSSVHAIDLHTHLLPPSHGALCLWGIDEL